MDSLRVMGMLDDVGTLLGNLGFIYYVKMKCVSYDRLVLEHLSSAHVDGVGCYTGNEVLITFHMFYTDHVMSLRGLMSFSSYHACRCL